MVLDNMPFKNNPNHVTRKRRPLVRKASPAGTKALVERSLSALEPRMRSVICERFGLWEGLPVTLQEIGNRLGLTRERVRQIEVAGMSRLRAGLPARLENILQAKVKASKVLRQSDTLRVLAERELREAVADDCADYEASGAISLLQELWCPEESLCQRCFIQAEDHVFALTKEEAKKYRALVNKVERRLLRAGGAISKEELASGRLARSAGCTASDLARVIQVSPRLGILSNGDLTLVGQPAIQLEDFPGLRELGKEPAMETAG
jgi:hypothetical protein